MENDNAWQRLDHLNAVLHAIRNVGHLIVHEENPQRLLQEACHNLIQTRGYLNAWIALTDKSGSFMGTAEAGLGDNFSRLEKLLRCGKLPACGKRAMGHHGVIITKFPQSLCTGCPLANSYGGGDAMAIRLDHEGRVYGLLSVCIPAGLADDEEERSLFKEIAEDLAFALHRIELEMQYAQAEKTLHQREERFRELFNNMRSGVAIFDADHDGGDFTLINLNRAGEKIDGISGRRPIGKHVVEAFGETVGPLILKVLQRVWESGEPEQYPLIQYADGEVTRWIESYVYRLPSGEMVMLYDDVTEQKQTEKCLEVNKARYEALFENASDGILVRDLEGNIVMINQATANITGYGVDELASMNISAFLPPSSLATVVERQKGLLDGKSNVNSERYEIRLTRKDGKERIVEVVTSLLSINGRSPIVQAVLRDVTEERLSREQIRTYAHEITRAQEEERKRIARELHDETIQSLASLGIEIDSLITANDPASQNIVHRLGKLRERTDGLLAALRRLTQDLRPPMLDVLGLAEALQWLADNLTADAGIDARLEVIGQERRFSAEQELLLFRIVQEALTNVRKHSKASHADIRMEFMANGIEIDIKDNGHGFEVPEEPRRLVQRGKLGLIGMQERARLLNATLDIDSQVGSGTTVSVWVKR